MNSTSALLLSVRPSDYSGNIVLSLPVTCRGMATTATVKLYIYEGSLWPQHGAMLASYSQEVQFGEGETKDMAFSHAVIATGESRRDVGVEVIVDGQTVVSKEFDDVYHVNGSSGSDFSSMMGMMVAVMMMGMMMPMLEEGMG